MRPTPKPFRSRRVLFSLLCALFALTGAVSQGSESYLSSITLKPEAARALVEAVKLFDCKKQEQPYCLSPYTALVLQHGTNAQVIFLANEDRRSFTVTIPNAGKSDIKTGGTPAVDVPPIVVPGTTAGALAMAWARINRADGGSAILDGLSRVELYIEPGTTVVVFFPQLSGTSGKCIADNCDSRWGYRIQLIDGKAIIRP